jgi:hypothetical protein
VPPLQHDTDSVFNPTEDWESEANHEGFSIGGDAHMEPDRTAYDVIEEFHDQLEEKTLEEQGTQPTDLSG